MTNPNTACRVSLQEVQISKTLDERLELQRWSWELGELMWRSSAIQVFFEGFGRLHESRGPSHDSVDVHVCITDTELGNHGVKVPQNCQETP